MKILVTMATGPIRDGFFPAEVVRKLDSLGDVR